MKSPLAAASGASSKSLPSLYRLRNKAGTDYVNYAPLIEVVVHLLLPGGQTRPLKGLVDTGATDA